jgi:hypothetical protein
MAGFPPISRNGACKSPESSKSSECPESRQFHESPECPVSRVYPVSNGQELEKELERLAVSNACTCAGDATESKFFKLTRDVRGLEKGIKRKLIAAERILVFDVWYYLSRGLLDAGKGRDDYLAEYFSKLGKVRVPTGEGDTLNKALEAVSKLSVHELPEIPGMPKAPESWRRLAALHRELFRLSGGKTYFLSYRDAAKAFVGLNHQTAHNITLALALPELGVIKIVHKGKAGLNSGEAAEFRYLLPRAEFPGEKDDEDECPF